MNLIWGWSFVQSNAIWRMKIETLLSKIDFCIRKYCSASVWMRDFAKLVFLSLSLSIFSFLALRVTLADTRYVRHLTCMCRMRARKVNEMWTIVEAQLSRFYAAASYTIRLIILFWVQMILVLQKVYFFVCLKKNICIFRSNFFSMREQSEREREAKYLNTKQKKKKIIAF